MSLYLEEESDVKLDLDCKAIADTVVEAALEYCGCPYEAEINVLLTDNTAIQEMNQMYRKINRPTDVLSFPMIEYSEPANFDFLENREDCFNPETGELILGDIVISKDKVISQSEEYGHSLKREYAFLIAHSMLHLFGYDHIDHDDRVIMEEKQKDILELIQILR